MISYRGHDGLHMIEPQILDLALASTVDLDKASDYGTVTTDAQRQTIAKLRDMWNRVGKPQPTIGCNNAVVCEVGTPKTVRMWIIIEWDGYAHS